MPDTEQATMDFDPQRFLANIMNFNTQAEYAMTWEAYRAIYALSPSSFIVMGDLHQNSINDVLHLSVSISMPSGRVQNIHYNGYWRNGFKCVNVTRSELNGTPSTIAVFMDRPVAPAK